MFPIDTCYTVWKLPMIPELLGLLIPVDLRCCRKKRTNFDIALCEILYENAMDLNDSPVAKNLKTYAECKSRWRTIRDNFKRHRKGEVSGTGQPATKKRATYWVRLRFLDDVEDERQGFTNTEEVDSSAGAVKDVVNVSPLIVEVGTEQTSKTTLPTLAHHGMTAQVYKTTTVTRL
ncbi:hypothetical protein J6590_083931 [Homalodisca vitripennis]|nr:hypothetical protein J6590_083931 [Homalodisca vitripennis]